MELLPTLFGVGCLALVVVTVVLVMMAARRDRRRRDRLVRWAAAHGWTITARPVVSWGARLPGADPGGVTLAVSGWVQERTVSIAEYSYSEAHASSAPDGVGGTTTTTTVHTQDFVATVVRLTRPLPEITVTPRGALSRFARGVLGPGETAVGHAAFDRAFRISTTAPGAVRQWCTPALIAAQLAGHVPATWSLYGGELLCYRQGLLDRPERIPAEVAPALHLAALLD